MSRHLAVACAESVATVAAPHYHTGRWPRLTSDDKGCRRETRRSRALGIAPGWQTQRLPRQARETMKKTIEQRVAELTREEVAITPYQPRWLRLLEEEARHLRHVLPSSILRRIEHFGSTAVRGLSAKPIIDILVEISRPDEVKRDVVPILEAEGYDYFWRPTIGDDPPHYAWFIKRDADGKRTHHIHMVEADSQLWERLYFIDYLKEFPREAKAYSRLKEELSRKFPNDRTAYTVAKAEFIVPLTQKAVAYYIKRETAP